VEMFFAFLVLFVCKLLIINKLLVEAAGVEPASEIAHQYVAYKPRLGFEPDMLIQSQLSKESLHVCNSSSGKGCQVPSR